jgi:ubiquinol-cytochrome c reductase cytochrome c1 subunit
MVRLFGPLVGLGFCAALLIGLAYSLIGMATAQAEPEINTTEYWHRHARDAQLPSDGPLGRYNQRQLQRGLAVFQNVCSSCHSMSLVSFRDFADLGYNEDQIKTLASGWPIQVPSVNADTGEAATRPGLPSDRLPAPYANDVAARAANNNAIPPDLSLITKAREGGADYVYSLITGYRRVPANLPAALRPGQGLHYNPYFHSLNIAMAPPLTSAGQVTYAPGNPPATVDQMARDVSAFLSWAAEPEANQRKRSGWTVLGFLAIFTLLAFLSYRAIWADKKAH